MNTKTQVIVVWPYRFRDFDWQRFEFSNLENHVEVHVQELIEALSPEFAVAYANQSELPNVARYSSIYSWYLNFRKISKDAIVFSHIKPIDLRTLIICLGLRFSGAKVVGFVLGGAVVPGFSLNPRRSIVPNFVKNLYHFVRRNYLRFAMPELVVVGGSEAERMAQRDFPGSTQMILANSSDYSQFLRIVNRPAFEEKYSVYLDTGFPGFPRDELLTGRTEQVRPENWYPNLSRFFNQVEATLDLRVEVAIHPKHVGRDHEPLFGNRRAIGGQTPERVSTCELVIATNSTAISYAVCFKKPLFLVTSDLIESGIDSRKHSFIHNFSRETGAKIFNIDLEYPEHEIRAALAIDEEKRKSYRLKYLTSREDGKPNYQVLLDEVINPHLAELERKRSKKTD